MNEDALIVLESEEYKGVVVEVVEYLELKGSGDLETAQKVFFANEAKIHLKFVRITLKNNKSITIEPGALYFMKGNMELGSSIEGGVARGMFRKLTTGETLFQSTIKGDGVIYLEPTFSHFMMASIDDMELIMDDGSFYAATEGVSVSGALQSNISSALLGGESMVQTSVKGTGVVVINIPVPESELIVYTLDKGEKLQIDGNFALMRTSDVTFSVEKSGKSFFQSVTSGEGLLQTFTGPGTVWFAPTQVVYDRIKVGGLEGMRSTSGKMSNNTQ